jgi:hypothetical protein
MCTLVCVVFHAIVWNGKKIPIFQLSKSLTNDPFSCNVWGKIYYVFKSNNLDITIKLKHLIFGYKISDNNYYGVNYFITILGFSIHKSYYLSEQKTKNTIFIYEFNKRINEIKNHNRNNSFLYAMKKKINSS